MTDKQEKKYNIEEKSDFSKYNRITKEIIYKNDLENSSDFLQFFTEKDKTIFNINEEKMQIPLNSMGSNPSLEIFSPLPKKKEIKIELSDSQSKNLEIEKTDKIFMKKYENIQFKERTDKISLSKREIFNIKDINNKREIFNTNINKSREILMPQKLIETSSLNSSIYTNRNKKKFPINRPLIFDKKVKSII